MRVLTIHRAPRCPSGRGDKSYGPQFRYPNNRQIGLTTPVIQIPEQLSDGCRFSERRHLGPGHPREEHAAREESVVGLWSGSVPATLQSSQTSKPRFEHPSFFLAKCLPSWPPSPEIRTAHAKFTDLHVFVFGFLRVRTL